MFLGLLANMIYVLQVAAILMQIIGQIILNVILIPKLKTIQKNKKIIYILDQCYQGVYAIVLRRTADVCHYLKYYSQMPAHITANTVLIK